MTAGGERPGAAASGTERVPRRARWRWLRWVVLAASVVATVALGVWGFALHLRALGQPLSWTGLLYLALQLFTLESGAPAGSVPWQLDVARFLAPGLAVFTALQALAALFRDELQAWRAGRRQGHVVICGLGRKGQLLVRRFRAAGENVVAIERDEDDPGIALCREVGALVLVGDATEPSTLRRAGVRRARLLVAVCGRDGDNAAIAVAARHLVAGRGTPPLVAIVHLVDDELCALLRERELSATSRDGFRLELFNVFESGAAAMFEEVPGRTAGASHRVIVGLGHFGITLLRHLLRRVRPAAGLRVTLVDIDAGRLGRALAEAVPGAQLDGCELDVRSSAFAAARFALDDSGRPTADAVYICLDDDGAALAAALALHRRLGSAGVPIAVRLAEESGLATLLAPGADADDGFRDLHGFGLLERTCRPERLLAVSREKLAQAIHAAYRARRIALGAPPEDDPALAPWGRLAEGLRESNRAQADDIGRKLAAVDCEMHTVGPDAGEPFAFAAAEIERLAEMEHARFVEERAAAGWTYAPGPKDLERKTSPHLVPWSELDEPVRDLDRETVRQLPAFLAAIGFEIQRSAPGASGEAD